VKSTELTIETLGIEIKVIRVGGHKMTISVFDQLEEITLLSLLGYSDFREFKRSEPEWADKMESLNTGSIEIKGYILRSGEPYLFYTMDGKPYKTLLRDKGIYGTVVCPPWGDHSIVPWVKDNFSQLFIAT